MDILTEKEKRIAAFAASGKTSQEIAALIGISHETVRWYRKKMLRKLGARNFNELTALLKDRNII